VTSEPRAPEAEGPSPTPQCLIWPEELGVVLHPGPSAAFGIEQPEANAGLDQYGVIFNGENAASAGAYNGFMGAWNGAEIPSQVAQNPDGSVDVNGDGLSNGAFMGSQNIALYDITTQPIPSDLRAPICTSARLSRDTISESRPACQRSKLRSTRVP